MWAYLLAGQRARSNVRAEHVLQAPNQHPSRHGRSRLAQWGRLLRRGNPVQAAARFWRRLRLHALAPTLLMSDDESGSGSLSEEDEALLSREWRVHAAAALVLIFLMFCVMAIVLLSPSERPMLPIVIGAAGCPRSPMIKGESLEDKILAKHVVVVCGVPGVHSTVALETALRVRGARFVSVPFDAPPADQPYSPGSSPVWDWLRCRFPAVETGGQVPRSYLFLHGKLAATDFGAAVAVRRGLLDGPLGLTGMSCEERFQDDARQFQRFQADPDARVLLFGWTSCPCTAIAEERFSKAQVCYEGRTWTEPMSTLMAYLQCKENKPADHSFVYFRFGHEANSTWSYFGNGFQLDPRAMLDSELDGHVQRAGSVAPCVHVFGEVNLLGQRLEPCGLDARGAVTICDNGAADFSRRHVLSKVRKLRQACVLPPPPRITPSPKDCEAFAGQYLESSTLTSNGYPVSISQAGCRGAVAHVLVGGARASMVGNQITVPLWANVSGTLSGGAIHWANGVTYLKAPQRDHPGWKNSFGATCEVYQKRGWCANGGFVSGAEWTGKVGVMDSKCLARQEPDCAKLFDYPGLHCAACGRRQEQQGSCVPLGGLGHADVAGSNEKSSVFKCAAIPETAFAAMLSMARHHGQPKAARVAAANLKSLFDDCLKQAEGDRDRVCRLRDRSLQLLRGGLHKDASSTADNFTDFQAALERIECSDKHRRPLAERPPDIVASTRRPLENASEAVNATEPKAVRADGKSNESSSMLVNQPRNGQRLTDEAFV